MTRAIIALAVVGVLAACSSGTEEITATSGTAPTSADGATSTAGTAPPSTVSGTTSPDDVAVTEPATSADFVELGAVQEPIAMQQPGEYEPAAMPQPVLEGDGPLTPLAAPVELVFDWGAPCSVPARSTVVEQARGVGSGETLITELALTVSLTEHARGFEIDSLVTAFGGGLGGGDGATATSVPIEARPVAVDDLVNVQRPVLLIAPDGFPLAARLRDGVGPGDDGYDFVADDGNLVSKAMDTYQDTVATWLTVWSLRGVAGPDLVADVAQLNGIAVTNQWQALGGYADGTVHLVLAQQLVQIPAGEQTVSGTVQFEAIVDPSSLRPDVAMSWLRASSDATGEVVLDERSITTFEWADAEGCGS